MLDLKNYSRSSSCSFGQTIDREIWCLFSDNWYHTCLKQNFKALNSLFSALREYFESLKQKKGMPKILSVEGNGSANKL